MYNLLEKGSGGIHFLRKKMMTLQVRKYRAVCTFFAYICTHINTVMYTCMCQFFVGMHLSPQKFNAH